MRAYDVDSSTLILIVLKSAAWNNLCLRHLRKHFGNKVRLRPVTHAFFCKQISCIKISAVQFIHVLHCPQLCLII
jgi:hypothetical protein